MLTPRQVLLYEHTCDLYKSIPGPPDDDNVSGDITYKRVATNLPCYFFMTPEENTPMAPGRTKEENTFTMDRLHVPADTVDADGWGDGNVMDGWAVQNTTPGHPLQGAWWFVQGNPQTVANTERRKPNYRRLLLQREPQPQNIVT